MKAFSSVATLAIAVALLVGCAPATNPPGEASTPTATATPSPTPTIDPGPVTLTVAEAGERYLGIVCQRNFAYGTLTALINEKEDAFLNGAEPRIDDIVAAADVALVATRGQVELFDDSYYVWPEGVSENLEILRDANLSDSATLSSMVNSPDYAGIYYATWTSDENAAAAAQEVRYLLDLPANAVASCEGYETAEDELLEEKAEREAYLATFTD